MSMFLNVHGGEQWKHGDTHRREELDWRSSCRLYIEVLYTVWQLQTEVKQTAKTVSLCHFSIIYTLLEMAFVFIVSVFIWILV